MIIWNKMTEKGRNVSRKFLGDIPRGSEMCRTETKKKEMEDKEKQEGWKTQIRQKERQKYKNNES
jgi:hypothetical protein